MQNRIDAASVVAYHDRQVRERDWPVMYHVPDQAGAWPWIDANHRYNGLLWRERERMRRLDVPPSEIAAGQRLVERYDGKRVDAVEAIDDMLLAGLGHVVRQPGARWVRDTADSMIDRLAVLALQIHQLRTCGQDDAASDEACARMARLDRLLAQRGDVAAGLDVLLVDVRAGRACFNVARKVRTVEEAWPEPYFVGRMKSGTGGRP